MGRTEKKYKVKFAEKVGFLAVELGYLYGDMCENSLKSNDKNPEFFADLEKIMHLASDTAHKYGGR